ncbi:alkaline phosphatase D family protein [Winogradskya consettensis]|uniref:alkaline phosphatase D family protein n=1 Tax=Winogradskya consettensis TaxID=113560 RepID=UPI001BB3EF97|nr:alkaline phosphatase D family protein [Actinoplanes consettensis]
MSWQIARDERFRHRALRSGPAPAGRTETVPTRSARGQLSFGIVNCQDFQNGYWQAYRARHAQYKSDPALRASHAAFPWIVMWDDHETENNYASLVDEIDDTGAAHQNTHQFARPRVAAYQAYYAHIPIRASLRPGSPDLRIIQSTWLSELHLDFDHPDRTPVAVEITATSISSDFPAAYDAPIKAINPTLKPQRPLLRRLPPLLPTAAPSTRALGAPTPARWRRSPSARPRSPRPRHTWSRLAPPACTQADLRTLQVRRALAARNGQRFAVYRLCRLCASGASRRLV